MAEPFSNGISLTADTDTNVGQAGASGGFYIVHILNSSADSDASLQIGASGVSQTFEDGRRFVDDTIASKKEASFGPVVLTAGEYIVARSDIDSVSVMMMGYND